MSIEISYPSEHVAIVSIFNETRRNALGVDEFKGLATAWELLEATSRIRSVVVTGAGKLAFCSGAQLDVDFSVVPGLDDLIDAALLKTRAFKKPLIAAVNGHCVAGGFELMLSCDVRVASDQALLGLPEARWGILPSGGGAMKLREQIGHARSMELLLTGELISADKALEYGLVNQVVAQNTVLERSIAIAEAVARNSPLAIRLTKESALLARSHVWKAEEAQERVRAAKMRASIDNSIGRRAFLEKTMPKYPD